MPENLSGYFLVIAFSVWYISHQAGRLDRLHHRIEVAQAALDGQLIRRAGIAVELVALNFLDPASEAYLVQSAHDVLAGQDLPDSDRLANESELTAALIQSLDDQDYVNEFRRDQAIGQLLTELGSVSKRIQLAKRFHTEAVGDCDELREQFLVRFFHLAGHAKKPSVLEFDDRIPAPLAA